MTQVPGVHRLSVPRFEQPDDVSCGPSSLYSVLRYHGTELDFDALRRLVPTNEDGGTLSVYLGLTALRMGYQARLYSYNLHVLDPTWRALDPTALEAKLRARAEGPQAERVRQACSAYADFVHEGGEIDFADLSPELLVRALDRGHPLVCGTNATYLYVDPRERPDDNKADDVHGDPVGHFLVVSGHDGPDTLYVTDPAPEVPHDAGDAYAVTAQRLINAILLGIVSFDAVLLEVWPLGPRPTSIA